MARSKVAVLRTRPETVLDDYVRAMKLAEIDKFIDVNKTTILKDNISWHFPFPGANTTPWQMEATILGLQSIGNKDIVCVQNETVVTRAHKGEKLNKYDIVFKKYNIPVLYNFLEKDMKWIKYEPKAEMKVLNQIFPNGIMIPDYFFGKNIVHQPTMKCHIYTTTTGAMKNAFGGLLNRSRFYTHTVIHETLVDLLKIQYEIHSGVFAVMDGTTAGNGPGPRTMIPVEKNVILASADQVAIDAVSASMMGFEPMDDIKYIRLAHEAGLGKGRLDEIEIVGDTEVAKEKWGFHVGANFAAKYGGHPLWFGPMRHMQKFFFQTPMVYLFIFASFAYHDMIHWPMKGNSIYKEWLEESQWGRLFGEY
ncbi:MAG: DUF362 domain-containing protein [bacterium]|nr:DUF362 domain-containing protein [bacterium]